MKHYIAISFIIGVSYGASMYDAGGSAAHGSREYGHGGGEHDHGSVEYGHGSGEYGDEYGGQKCYPTFETKYKEQCEDYHEKVCYTTQKEKCKDVNGKKCKAIASSKHERKCHDVSELLCSLKENVHYEEIPAVFTVQKCHKATERVCDTVYETELTEKDDFKCINVVNPHCAMKEHTVYDKTCRTLVNFDCKAEGYGSDHSHSPGDHDSDAFGSYNSQDDSYGGSEYAPQHKCKRSYDTKCYTTPRTVSTEYCEDREEKVCEKLTERVPVPVEKQNCHDEKKKLCELEQRSQPKQVKKYVYTKHCRPIPKTVCDNADQMWLQPSCVPYSRKQCTYHPEEKCENVPKQHCYKIPYQVKKMECTGGSETSGYGEEDYKGEDHYKGDAEGY